MCQKTVLRAEEKQLTHPLPLGAPEPGRKWLFDHFSTSRPTNLPVLTPVHCSPKTDPVSSRFLLLLSTRWIDTIDCNGSYSTFDGLSLLA